MIGVSRIPFVGALLVALLAAPGPASVASTAQPAPHLQVTNVSFLWWTSFKPLDPQGNFGSKGTHALVMGDHVLNDYLVVNATEWTKGSTTNQPAAFQKKTQPFIYARFLGIKDDAGPPKIAGVKEALISADSGTEGMPGIKEEKVTFDPATGEMSDFFTPEKPSIKLHKFKLTGAFPDTVGVKTWKLNWKAKNVTFSDNTVAPEIPTEIVGSSEHEIYLVDKNTIAAENELRKTPFKMRFFFKKVVKWSCENFPAPQGDIAKLDAYSDAFPSFGAKYIFPNIFMEGYTTPANMAANERLVDGFIENNRGSCGTVVFTFGQAVIVQGIHGLDLRNPQLLPKGGQPATSGSPPQQEAAAFNVPRPAGESGTQQELRQLFTGPNFDKFADTFQTRSLTGLNTETKRWRWNDHRYLEKPLEGPGRRFYDPSYTRKETKDDWFEYLLTLLEPTTPAPNGELSVKKANAAQFNNRWMPDRGFFTPEDVTFRNRVANGPNLWFIMENRTGDTREGKAN